MFLATEWGEAKGGINAFNRDLVLNCGLQCKGKYGISCCVIEASPAEIKTAQENGVKLISLSAVLGITSFSEDREQVEKITDLLRNGEDSYHFIVGHDIFTGPAAVAVAKALRARSVVFIHSNYAAYKFIQDSTGGQRSREKEAVQERTVRMADRVFGVGPLLTQAAHDMDGLTTKKRRRRIKNFIPGLPIIDPPFAVGGFSAFSFGRYEGKNEILKQQHLAVAAYCEFVRSLEHDLSNKRFTLVGLSNDPVEFRRQDERIKELVQKYAEGAITLHCREFLQRIDAWELLRKASVSMMLSWHEGFGLVGWETIAAGVPLILSENSGLFQFLDDRYSHLGACYWATPIRGRYDGELNSSDVSEVAAILRRMYGRRDKIRRHAVWLRTELLRVYNWRRRARMFVRSLNPDTFRFGPSERSLRKTG